MEGEVAHLRSMKQLNLKYIRWSLMHNTYQDAVLFSGTTFLPGPLSTDSSKGLPTPDSIRTKTHKIVPEFGGTGS